MAVNWADWMAGLMDDYWAGTRVVMRVGLRVG